MSTTTYTAAGQDAFDRTLTEIKNGVATAIQSHTLATESAVKSAKDLAAFSQGTLEAVLQANQIFFAGAQTLARQVAANGEQAFSETLAGARALAQSKTPQSLLDAQSTLVRTAFERTVTESSRLARVSFDLAEKTAAPVLARLVVAAETFTPKA